MKDKLNKVSNLQSNQSRITISLETQVYQRLRVRGRFGESFSQLVERLLDDVESPNAGGTEG